MGQSAFSAVVAAIWWPVSDISLYTPWIETGDALRARHIDREEELAVLVEGVQRLIQGTPALPLYFFGPHGTGKSHLLALILQELRPTLMAAGVAVHLLSEDIPPCTSAHELWRRMASDPTHAPWLDWGLPLPVVQITRALVVIEGFDRHLRALQTSDCRAFRALLREHPEIWLVTTGTHLPDAMTGKDAAFFGTFDTRSLQPLRDTSAGDLLDRQVSDDVRTQMRWPARKATVLTLTGGNPRVLLALAKACSATPQAEIAHSLLKVLDDVTPYVQLRFQDLSTHEQQLVELLSLAPRCLGPTEIASRLGGVPSTWSTIARRLQDQEILSVQQEGRNAWYRISEPLFRYWLEYRGAPWHQTRVAWVGRLLEQACGPAGIDRHMPPLSDLLTVALSPEDANLPALLAMAVAQGHHRVADRILATLDLSNHPCLPVCPWPGRRLLLDLPTLAHVMVRGHHRALLTWLGALTDVTEDAFGQVVSHLKASQQEFFIEDESVYQLALTGLALRRPDRRDQVRAALGLRWQEIFAGVEVLERQLRESERGPLHPELARLNSMLGAISPDPIFVSPGIM